MHVGPMKMATTTVQDALTKYSETLELDNYYYLGKVNSEYKDYYWDKPDVYRAFVNTCFVGKVVDTQCDQLRKWVRRHVERHLNKGHNVLVSAEEMGSVAVSDRGWERLRETFAGFRVRVVVAYRRYHEWLPSYYRHMFRAHKYHKHMFKHPEDGGARVPSFGAFLADPAAHLPAALVYPVAGGQHISTRTRDAYAAAGFDVSVWNLHAVSPDAGLVQDLLCHVIPGANRACAAASRPGSGRDMISYTKVKCSQAVCF